jgi:hypothetical protein
MTAALLAHDEAPPYDGLMMPALFVHDEAPPEAAS